MIAAATSSSSHVSNHAGSSTTAKKIDEIVSGVIDRVMANQKEQNKSAQEPPSNAQMLPPTLGVEQLQELYRLNPALFNSFNAQQQGAGISGVQSLLSTVKVGYFGEIF